MGKFLDILPWYVRWPLTVMGLVIGSYMGVETWVISKANTVVEPVRIEVHQVSKRSDDLLKAMDDRMDSMDEKLNILIQRGTGPRR